MKKKIYYWLSLLRVNQYTKNLFVLAPVFFSFKFRTLHFLYLSLIGFILYSITASSVYIINDLVDIKEDALHPVKRNRAFPSGKISVATGIITAVLFLGTSFSLGFFLNLFFGEILVLYFLINVLYSLWFKRFAIADILIISIGFVLRIYAGGALTNVVPSMWLTLMTFLLSLILALGKRRDDVLLKKDGVKVRYSVSGYNLELLNYSIVSITSVTIVCYIQYIISPEIIKYFHNPYLYCNIIFVIAGFLRYFQTLFVRGGTSNPSKIILKDHFLQANIILWLVSFIIFIK